MQQKRILGFYQGFFRASYGIFAYRAAYFGIFDSAKTFLTESWKDSIFINLLLGWVASYGAFTASLPFDIIQRRILMMEMTMQLRYR
jgi:solute carrier family 25 (mitochondrial adenine nucleotide translocator), member 4/5/6/31